MDGWMVGQIDGWMARYMDRQTGRKRKQVTDRWMGGGTDVKIDVCKMARQKGGQMGG